LTEPLPTDRVLAAFGLPPAPERTPVDRALAAFGVPPAGPFAEPQEPPTRSPAPSAEGEESTAAEAARASGLPDDLADLLSGTAEQMHEQAPSPAARLPANPDAASVPPPGSLDGGARADAAGEVSAADLGLLLLSFGGDRVLGGGS